MTLKTIFTLCSKLCHKKAELNPDSGFSCKGEKITYTQLEEELKKLIEWCYPTDTSKLKPQLCCIDCEHYKKFRHVESKRDRRTVMLCELDKLPKQKEHYCGYACPKKVKGLIETSEERIEDFEQHKRKKGAGVKQS